jgi:hypothetical protein
MKNSAQVPDPPSELADFRAAIIEVLPSFADLMPQAAYLRFGLRMPSRYLLLPTSFAPLQVECHQLAPLRGHASCEVLDLLSETPTPVAASVLVYPGHGRYLPIKAILASEGRRETVLDLYLRATPLQAAQRFSRLARAPEATASGLVESSIDLGLRQPARAD